MTHDERDTTRDIDIPLHVRVATALGYDTRDASVRDCRGQCVHSVSDSSNFPRHDNRHDHIRWEYYKRFEYEPSDGDWYDCPRYDTDWSATGPLIEALSLSLDMFMSPVEWVASYGGGYDQGSHHGRATTPLAAVCVLIEALHAAGIDIAAIVAAYETRHTTSEA